MTSQLDNPEFKQLFEKAFDRQEGKKLTEADLKDIFNSIDKDCNGELTKAVSRIQNRDAALLCRHGGQEAVRACKKTNVMDDLGIDDVEQWLAFSDKDGVRSCHPI